MNNEAWAQAIKALNERLIAEGQKIIYKGVQQRLDNYFSFAFNHISAKGIDSTTLVADKNELIDVASVDAKLLSDALAYLDDGCKLRLGKRKCSMTESYVVLYTAIVETAIVRSDSLDSSEKLHLYDLLKDCVSSMDK